MFNTTPFNRLYFNRENLTVSGSSIVIRCEFSATPKMGDEVVWSYVDCLTMSGLLDTSPFDRAYDAVAESVLFERPTVERRVSLYANFDTTSQIDSQQLVDIDYSTITTAFDNAPFDRVLDDVAEEFYFTWWVNTTVARCQFIQPTMGITLTGNAEIIPSVIQPILTARGTNMVPVALPVVAVMDAYAAFMDAVNLPIEPVFEYAGRVSDDRLYFVLPQVIDRTVDPRMGAANLYRCVQEMIVHDYTMQTSEDVPPIYLDIVPTCTTDMVDDLLAVSHLFDVESEVRGTDISPYIEQQHTIRQIRDIPSGSAKKYLELIHGIDYHSICTVIKQSMVKPGIAAIGQPVDEENRRYIETVHDIVRTFSHCKLFVHQRPAIDTEHSMASHTNIRHVENLDATITIPAGVRKKILRLEQAMDTEVNPRTWFGIRVIADLNPHLVIDRDVFTIQPTVTARCLTEGSKDLHIIPAIKSLTEISVPDQIAINVQFTSAIDLDAYITTSVAATLLVENTNSFIEVEYIREFSISSVHDVPVVESSGISGVALSDYVDIDDITTESGEPVLFRLLNHWIIIEDSIATSDIAGTNEVFNETVVPTERITTKLLDSTPQFNITGTVWSIAGEEVVASGATVHLIRRYNHLIRPDFVPVTDTIELHHFDCQLSLPVCEAWNRDVAYSGEVVDLGTFDVIWNGVEQVYLSTAPDEITAVSADDQLVITTDEGTLEFGYFAQDEYICNITSILKIGMNHVTIQVRDIHSESIGTPTLYIVNNNPHEIPYDDVVVDGGSIPSGQEEDGDVDTTTGEKLYPIGNLPDYMTTTDEYGRYVIPNLVPGVYTVVVTKPGYSVGFAEVNVTQEDVVDVGVTIIPLQSDNIIERVYNHYGHIFKMYRTRDEVISDRRIVEYTLLFGDLYGTSATVWNLHEDGFIQADVGNTGGVLEIIDLPYLGRFGSLELTQENVTMSNRSRTISWHNVASIGDFTGFKIRYSFSSERSGFLDFSISTPVGFLEFGDDASKIININEVYHERIPEWNQLLTASFTDGFSIIDDVGITSITPTSQIHLLTLEDICPIRSDFTQPCGVRVFGILVSESGQRKAGCPIVVSDPDTQSIVTIVKTNTRGEWQVDGLQPGKTYDVYASDVTHGALPVRGTFTSSVRDIMEARLMETAESDSFRGMYAERYLDVMSILSPMPVNNLTGRIQGRIYNDDTDEDVESAFIRVYPGHLTMEEIENYTGMVFTGVSGVTPNQDPGFYSVYTDVGDLTVIADAVGYKTFGPLHITISGGCALDIGMRYVVLSGYVHRAIESSYDKAVPIVGATVTLGDMTTTTDETGYYEFTAGMPSVIQGETVTVRAKGYRPVEKTLPSQIGKPITDYNLRMWRQIAYGGKLI